MKGTAQQKEQEYLQWARADSKESADFDSLAFVVSNMEKSTARTIFLDIWNIMGFGFKDISKRERGLFPGIETRIGGDWMDFLG